MGRGAGAWSRLSEGSRLPLRAALGDQHRLDRENWGYPMKELMGRLKREMDFLLPQNCKKPRSSVHYLKNPGWDYLHRPRRTVASPGKAQYTLGDSADIREDIDEDLDEVALALLEMSSPNQQICDHGKGAAHLDTLESEGRDYSFQSFDTSCRALQCKNNTLQAVPTIIITSGSSSSNANASEPKSTLNQPLDSFGIAGQSASPLSHQGSETVNFRQPRLSADSTCLMRSAPQSWGMTELDSRQDLGQNQGTRSQPIVSDRGLLSGKIGHTVSTGVTLPPLLHSASQKVKQELREDNEQTRGTTLSPLAAGPTPLPLDAHTQAILQQALQNRLASKGQPGRPIANTRGGKLIVLPDPIARDSSQATAGRSIAQLVTDGPKLLGAATTIASVTSDRDAEAQSLTLSRVPTLVLSCAHKPSRPNAIHSGEQTPYSKQAAFAGESAAKSLDQESISKQAKEMNPSRSGPVGGAVMEKKGKATVAVNSTSSGDESSEDNWLPNWSLNLYNALNPTVITTAFCFSPEEMESGPAKFRYRQISKT